MSASEVAPNPFRYAKLTAALTSRDRLSICVLAMFVHKPVTQLGCGGGRQTCQVHLNAFLICGHVQFSSYRAATRASSGRRSFVNWSGICELGLTRPKWSAETSCNCSSRVQLVRKRK